MVFSVMIFIYFFCSIFGIYQIPNIVIYYKFNDDLSNVIIMKHDF